MKKNLFVRIIIILNFLLSVFIISSFSFYTFFYKRDIIEFKHYVFAGGLVFALLFGILNIILVYIFDISYNQKEQKKYLDAQGEFYNKMTDVLEAIDTQMRKSNKLIRENGEMQEDFFDLLEIDKLKKNIEKSTNYTMELNNKFNPSINYSRMEKLLEEIKYASDMKEMNKKNTAKFNEINDNLKGIIFELKENADILKEMSMPIKNNQTIQKSEKNTTNDTQISNHLNSYLKENESMNQIDFKDNNLENEIKKSLKIQGRKITLEDANETKKLNINSKNVTNLSGIENFLNLEELDLWGTSIENIAAISELKKLKVLGLWKTKVKDLTPLRSLTNLEYLNLKETDIIDLSPIRGLTKLRHINLKNTEVEDLSPIAELSGLQYLDITETYNLDKTEGSVNKDIIRDFFDRGCDIPEY